MINFKKIYLVGFIEEFFLSVVLLELFLMGSGRLLEIGSITLRMVLYIICLALSALLLIFSKRRISKLTLIITGIFIILTLNSVLIGLLNGNDEPLIIEDIKPLSYFLMLLYFDLTIINIKRVKLVAKLVKFAAIVLAISYIGSILLVLTGKINFGTVYNLLEDSSDFMFRGQAALFYKGFVYMCLGVIFFLQNKNVVNIFSMLLCLVAIILTMTKGFILAILLVMFFQMFLLVKRKILLAPAILLLVTILIVVLSWFEVQLGDKSASDQTRIITMAQVSERMKSTSLFIGHGFGYGVPERPIHMEMSFVEIFHKQGIVGVLFWLSLIVSILYYFNKINNYEKINIAMPFMLASLFLYLESLTNPFINNPIGMSFLLISLVSIRYLAKKSDEIILNRI